MSKRTRKASPESEGAPAHLPMYPDCLAASKEVLRAAIEVQRATKIMQQSAEEAYITAAGCAEEAQRTLDMAANAYALMTGMTPEECIHAIWLEDTDFVEDPMDNMTTAELDEQIETIEAMMAAVTPFRGGARGDD